jgi:hypothetical protein
LKCGAVARFTRRSSRKRTLVAPGWNNYVIDEVQVKETSSAGTYVIMRRCWMMRRGGGFKGIQRDSKGFRNQDHHSFGFTRFFCFDFDCSLNILVLGHHRVRPRGMNSLYFARVSLRTRKCVYRLSQMVPFLSHFRPIFYLGKAHPMGHSKAFSPCPL